MLPVNTPIWIPDGNAGYTEGLVLEDFAPGQAGRVLMVKTQTEAVLPPSVSKHVERRIQEEIENAPNDLSNLIHLSRASLLEALRLRHEANKVYTSVGPILVSVNPYKPVPQLYTVERQAEYFEFRTNEPHVYETASRAFLGATKNRKDQSIIFSGESGAGKTFATRILTEFLVYASSRSENHNEERAVVQRRLQGAIPMIEAFGNAKTSRNDNSSRFGCWTEIEFSGNEICGASVTGFNLEKSRVVVRGEDQRNFHIFYQICAANPALSSRSFAYLHSALPTTAEDSKQDKEQFQATLKAMEELNIDAGKVLEIVEGILELGNLQFRAVDNPETKEELSEIVNIDCLERVCELLGGLDVADLSNALLIRDMSNPKEDIFRPHNKAQAEEARDAFAKHTYGRLFDWLMVQVNDATSTRKRQGFQSESKSGGNGHAGQGIIGLLDTYGFEVFTQNSFEQLCINYCNERIMSAFNDTCIKAEHELYVTEGLKLTSEGMAEPFTDRSKICLSLLEAQPGGVFALLDDEIRFPKGSDLQYLSRLRDAQKGHSNFVPYVSEIKDSRAKHLFGIVHFAGTVHYSVEGFLEKNRDTLLAQLDRVIQDSPGFLSQVLFAEELFSLSSSPKKTPQKGKKRSRSTMAHQKQSLGCRFRGQLNELMQKISLTQSHFVRCIKPNERSSAQFQGGVVLEQLNYGGVLETCRLRKDGFQVRRSHSDFLQTYQSLAKHAKTAEELARILAEQYGVSVQIGKTTAFLKAEDFNRLEKALVEQENSARVVIQSFGRSILERQKHSRRKQVLDKLVKAIATVDEEELDGVLGGKELREAFPKGCDHIFTVRKAKQMSSFIKEERDICTKLGEVTSRTFSPETLVELEQLLQKAQALDHDLKGNVSRAMLAAKEILAKWQEENKVLVAKDRDVRERQALLKIQRYVKRWLYARRVKAAFALLKEAMASKNPELCLKAIRRLSNLGLAQHPLVLEAIKVMPVKPAEIIVKKRDKQQLEKAMAELEEAVKVARYKSQHIKQLVPEDVAHLTYAINKARVEGLTEPELSDAIDLERQMLLAVANKKKSRWGWCCCTASPAVATTIPNNSGGDLALKKPIKIA